MDIPVTDADHQQIRREMAADLADAKLEIQVYKRQLSTALQAVAQRNTLIGNLRQEVEDAWNDRDSASPSWPPWTRPATSSRCG